MTDKQGCLQGANDNRREEPCVPRTRKKGISRASLFLLTLFARGENLEKRFAMTKKNATIVFTLVLGSLFILGTPVTMAAPPAKEIKEVVDYFYSGQKDGPILTDSKLCKSIKDLECEQPLEPNAVQLGDLIQVWMQFFVPKGGVYDDIMVEYKHEGVPRNLNAHKVESSIRYRVVDKYKIDKPGKWTITIKKATTSLKDFQITVIPK
jgi:hypothetical protein